MEERISINPKMLAFYTVNDAVKGMAIPYEEILNDIPIGKWVRCKDIRSNPDGIAQVSKLFNALYRKGLAEKRIVNDKPIEIEEEREKWIPAPCNGEPYYVEAFDKQGRSLGQVLNPFHKKSPTGEWVKVKNIHNIFPKHTEFRLLP